MKIFSEAALPKPILNCLDRIGFINTTPIQEQAIPIALKGQDILGTAQTGTGKTGAFGIPLVTHLLNSDKGSALVLLPTRELAQQVLETLEKFFDRSCGLNTALLIGGDSMVKQLRQLRNNPRIIVGTPGRINDHLKRKSLKIDRTDFLVLDEVDRMLDMGFGIQLDEIAKYLTSEKRQTLMFSATLPNNIKTLAGKYLNNPVRISVGSIFAPAEKVKQTQIKILESDKYPRLVKEIDERTGSVLIFVKTKFGADRMAKKLNKDGHKSDALHGDLRQSRRTSVINSFKNQNYRILVATDVAARGLDISHIEHVINYDLPQVPEDYIHRIGRTARAGAEGEAGNFISPQDGRKWGAIDRMLNPDAKPEKSEGNSRGGRPSRGGKGKRSYGKNDAGKNSRGGRSRSGGNGRDFVARAKEGDSWASDDMKSSKKNSSRKRFSNDSDCNVGAEYSSKVSDFHPKKDGAKTSNSNKPWVKSGAKKSSSNNSWSKDGAKKTSSFNKPRGGRKFSSDGNAGLKRKRSA